MGVVHGGLRRGFRRNRAPAPRARPEKRGILPEGEGRAEFPLVTLRLQANRADR